MKRIIWTLLVVAALLVPSLTALAVPQPAGSAQTVQQASVGTYLLRLPIPEAQLSAGAQPVALPGHFLAALQRQWLETEGVLHALKEQGLVEKYTLLHRDNAFQVTASDGALETLQQSGELLPLTKDIETLGQSFEHRLDAAIKASQAAMTPQAPELSPPAEPPSPPPPAALPPPPPAAEYLVRLVYPADPAGVTKQAHELIDPIEWLKQAGALVEYEWLPAAYAFRVRARGDLSSLRQRPEVADIVPYSEQAADEASAATAKSQQVMMSRAAERRWRRLERAHLFPPLGPGSAQTPYNWLGFGAA